MWSIPPHAATRVVAPDGVAVAVQDWASPGPAADSPDVLLIHGFSQSHGCWRQQFCSPLTQTLRLVTYDLRGHGASDKPERASCYQSADTWADEVHSVITQTGLHKPVLVAWSYAGRIALDYLQRYGDGGLSGLVMVNATSAARSELMGPAAALLAQTCDPDPAIHEPAVIAMLQACVAQPLPEDELAYMLAYNRLVPAVIRAYLRQHSGEYRSTLQSLRLPTWVVHGELDPINSLAMSQHTAAHIADAHLSVYQGVAHTPFWRRQLGSTPNWRSSCARTDLKARTACWPEPHLQTGRPSWPRPRPGLHRPNPRGY